MHRFTTPPFGGMYKKIEFREILTAVEHLRRELRAGCAKRFGCAPGRWRVGQAPGSGPPGHDLRTTMRSLQARLSTKTDAKPQESTACRVEHLQHGSG